jgi:hypothetical protein
MPFIGTRTDIEIGLARHRFNQPLPRPQQGLVTLTGEYAGAVTLIVTGTPDYSPSVGGWETVDRFGDAAVSWWKTRPLATLSLPCLLHIDVTGPVEAALSMLELIGQPRAGRDPSRVKVRGDVPPSAATATATWRLDALKYGERSYRTDNDSLLLWQEVSLDLTQFAEGKVAAAGGLKTRNRAGARNRRVVRARQGDTLRVLALRELGRAGDWKLLRSWNKKLAHTDPDALLALGTKVTVGGPASKKS